MSTRVIWKMLEISRGSLQPMLHDGAANSALLLSFYAEDWKTLSLSSFLKLIRRCLRTTTVLVAET